MLIFQGFTRVRSGNTEALIKHAYLVNNNGNIIGRSKFKNKCNVFSVERRINEWSLLCFEDIKIIYRSFHKIIASDIDKKLKRLTLIVKRNIIAKTKNYRRKNISASFLIRMQLNDGIIDIIPLPTELEKYKYIKSEHDNLIFGYKLYPSIYEITTIQLPPKKD